MPKKKKINTPLPKSREERQRSWDQSKIRENHADINIAIEESLQHPRDNISKTSTTSGRLQNQIQPDNLVERGPRVLHTINEDCETIGTRHITSTKNQKKRKKHLTHATTQSLGKGEEEMDEDGEVAVPNVSGIQESLQRNLQPVAT